VARQTAGRNGGKGRDSNGARGGKPRQRETEVLKAAAKVFYERGYAEASVQDIADVLGILKGSLYHYIEGKEDLLFWLLSETHTDVQKILDEVEAEDLPPLELLRLYTRRQVEYTARNLTRMTTYYNDMEYLSAKRRRELFGKRRTHDQFVTNLIRAAQAEGKADASLDASLAANFLFGSMIWVYRWYRPRGEVSSEELAESCADFVLHGIVGKT
jgi:TetR/AcrR family transcriptional regulator, cholesterol catabolism regulator